MIFKYKLHTWKELCSDRSNVLRRNVDSEKKKKHVSNLIEKNRTCFLFLRINELHMKFSVKVSQEYCEATHVNYSSSHL